MPFTVKQLAELSGVTVRTLHFYDQSGLLKPAYHGANGYRYYEEKQLLTLQQILFFRELGFELKQIQKLIGRSDFNIMIALKSHRKVLQSNLARTKTLIQTIDNTLAHLKGKKMKEKEFYHGFDEAKQTEYEQQLIDRFGGNMRQEIAKSRQRIKKWTKADWAKSSADFESICQNLTGLLDQSANSPAVQSVVRQHYQWLQQFWQPNKVSYAGHADFILDSELRQAYARHHPKLPDFIAAAMKSFAEKELH